MRIHHAFFSPRLAVQDGDNPPLAVRAVSGRYPAEEIVFRAAADLIAAHVGVAARS